MKLVDTINASTKKAAREIAIASLKRSRHFDADVIDIHEKLLENPGSGIIAKEIKQADDADKKVILGAINKNVLKKIGTIIFNEQDRVLKEIENQIAVTALENDGTLPRIESDASERGLDTGKSIDSVGKYPKLAVFTGLDNIHVIGKPFYVQRNDGKIVRKFGIISHSGGSWSKGQPAHEPKMEVLVNEVEKVDDANIRIYLPDVSYHGDMACVAGHEIHGNIPSEVDPESETLACARAPSFPAKEGFGIVDSILSKHGKDEGIKTGIKAWKKKLGEFNAATRWKEREAIEAELNSMKDGILEGKTSIKKEVEDKLVPRFDWGMKYLQFPGKATAYAVMKDNGFELLGASKKHNEEKASDNQTYGQWCNAQFGEKCHWHWINKDNGIRILTDHSGNETPKRSGDQSFSGFFGYTGITIPADKLDEWNDIRANIIAKADYINEEKLMGNPFISDDWLQGGVHG